jgi:hypothetical protein
MDYNQKKWPAGTGQGEKNIERQSNTSNYSPPFVKTQNSSVDLVLEWQTHYLRRMARTARRSPVAFMRAFRRNAICGLILEKLEAGP